MENTTTNQKLINQIITSKRLYIPMYYTYAVANKTIHKILMTFYKIFQTYLGGRKYLPISTECQIHQ